MKAFVRAWDKVQGYNKLGSDSTRIVSHHSRATMASFWGKVAREAAPGMSRVEVYWDDDKIYGLPDTIGYIQDGHILSGYEKREYEATLPVEQLVMSAR